MFKGLAWVSLILVFAVTLIGIFYPDVYRDEFAIRAQLVGQDIATLLVGGGLLLTGLLIYSRKTTMARLILLGCHFYLAYSYLIYSIGVRLNFLYLPYLAILAISLFSLFIGLQKLAGADLESFEHLNPPVVLTAVFLIVTAVMLALLWGSQLWDYYQRIYGDGVAADITKVEHFVFSLDFAFIIPLKVIGGILLLRRSSLGIRLSAPLMVLSVIMGVAILMMNMILKWWGGELEPTMALFFGVYTLVALVIGGYLFRVLAQKAA